MLLATDSERRTACHWAVKVGTGNITKILGWVKENLTTEEIKNNLLLASIYSFIKKILLVLGSTVGQTRNIAGNMGIV